MCQPTPFIWGTLISHFHTSFKFIHVHGDRLLGIWRQRHSRLLLFTRELSFPGPMLCFSFLLNTLRRTLRAMQCIRSLETTEDKVAVPSHYDFMLSNMLLTIRSLLTTRSIALSHFCGFSCQDLWQGRLWSPASYHVC